MKLLFSALSIIFKSCIAGQNLAVGWECSGMLFFPFASRNSKYFICILTYCFYFSFNDSDAVRIIGTL